MAPDAAPGRPRFTFEGKHFACAATIVGEGIDAREAGPQHLALQPQAVAALKVRQQAAVAIHALAGADQGDLTVLRDGGER